LANTGFQTVYHIGLEPILRDAMHR